ncbi:hypothetical protein MPLDJ20_130102 [Mesorhizobium plurifarium]|uniref:Uncharacterized protein n=1 Tax=Mesorhizobium plurifarium TaxID=69974 RepID=A0A090EJ67_MESPL|nr:hypothetical protein MPLDJ20_130102 [Mesorhizobium plurifarium]
MRASVLFSASSVTEMLLFLWLLRSSTSLEKAAAERNQSCARSFQNTFFQLGTRPQSQALRLAALAYSNGTIDLCFAYARLGSPSRTVLV